MHLPQRRSSTALSLALFASILCALPCSPGRAADDSLIPNGNFEASQTGTWPTGWGHPKSGTWEQENGNHFLRLTSTTPGEMDMLYQPFNLPPGCKALELSWRERVTGLKVGAKPWLDARVLVQFRDAANKEIKGGPGPSATGRDTNGWEARKMQFLVPDGASSVVFMPALFQATAGTFDLDDVQLKAIDAQPIITAAQTALAAAVEASKKAFVPLEQPQPAKAPKELHTVGNKVVDSDGKDVWLQGVNAGGMESVPADSHVLKSVIVGIDDWKSNIIRLPVKSTFWFGHGPYQKKDGGAYYRMMVDQAVTLASNRGAYLLLDLHRFRAPEQEDIDFWKDAAARYKNNPAVLFDLFNEPHDVSWAVWRNGGSVDEKKAGTTDESAFLNADEKAKSNAGLQSVGMQALLDTVRATGAKNIVVIGGLSWSGDLSGVVNGYALDEKGGNGIMYGWHNYNWHKNWQGRVLGAAAKYPIMVGEVGADIKKMTFIPLQDQEDPSTWAPDMIGFIQKYRLNWTAWCLHPKATPILITDWNYTPSPFWGVPVKEALAGKQFVMQRMR
jgi:endoglucanase